MLVVFDVAKEKLLDLRVQSCEPLFFLSVWEVEVRIGSRRDDVELGVEYVNSMDHTV